MAKNNPSTAVVIAAILIYAIIVFSGFWLWNDIDTENNSKRRKVKDLALVVAIANIFLPGLVFVNVSIWTVASLTTSIQP